MSSLASAVAIAAGAAVIDESEEHPAIRDSEPSTTLRAYHRVNRSHALHGFEALKSTGPA